MAHYLDTSALVKLVVAETETPALLAWLEADDRTPISSDLARTELVRAVRRNAPELATRATEVLDSIILLTLRPSIFEQAGRLSPTEIRSLDAIHLAAALDLGDDLDAIVTYDDRQANAATANGVPVISPLPRPASPPPAAPGAR